MKRALIASLLLLLPAAAVAREAGRGNPFEVAATPLAFDAAALAGTRLDFRGAIEMQSADPAFGGITGLRWSKDERRLFAVARTGRWFEIPVIERDGVLTGVGAVRGGRLLDLRGQPATGADADAEALDWKDMDGWTVLIGARQRLLRYAHLDGKPILAQLRTTEPRGGRFLNGNTTPEMAYYELSGGVSLEKLKAFRPDEFPTTFEDRGGYFVCARRGAQPAPNCASITANYGDATYHVGARDDETAVPTDMDGVILMQTMKAGQPLALVVQNDRPHKTLAAFAPPHGVALEGIAMRSEGARTYLYIVSDSTRTRDTPSVLMKFEVLTKPKRKP